ncbi:uncharacterized protein BCR38DRAFT_424645, partial [Pseudomassariella vexata]
MLDHMHACDPIKFMIKSSPPGTESTCSCFIEAASSHFRIAKSLLNTLRIMFSGL